MNTLGVAGLVGAGVLGAGVASYVGTRIQMGDKPGQVFARRIDPSAPRLGEAALEVQLGVMIGGLFSAPIFGAVTSAGTRPWPHGGAIGFAVLGGCLAAGVGMGIAQNVR